MYLGMNGKGELHFLTKPGRVFSAPKPVGFYWGGSAFGLRAIVLFFSLLTEVTCNPHRKK